MVVRVTGPPILEEPEEPEGPLTLIQAATQSFQTLDAILGKRLKKEDVPALLQVCDILKAFESSKGSSPEKGALLSRINIICYHFLLDTNNLSWCLWKRPFYSSYLTQLTRVIEKDSARYKETQAPIFLWSDPRLFRR